MRDTRTTQARAAIRLAGADLAPGATARTRCPFCDGGRNRDEAFYVTRSDDASYVLYVCHRASCGKRGRLSLSGYTPQVRDIRKVPSLEPWRGSLQRGLSDYWQAKYDSACLGEFKRAPHEVGLFGNADWTDECVWVLRDVNALRLGVQTRRDVPGRKIVKSHKETDKALYSYFPGKSDHGTWLVEDCLSAAALSSWGRRAVALLGTFLHDDVRAEITYSNTPGYIVALDPGAERDAAIVKQRLACYTTRPVHVLYLPKDFKNMNEKEQFAMLVRGRL
jgi:hypothetical protein